MQHPGISPEDIADAYSKCAGEKGVPDVNPDQLRQYCEQVTQAFGKDAPAQQMGR